MVDVAG